MSTKAEDESLDSGSRGDDYESPTERINNSLQKIRSELTEIRDQDLKLLKQLIQISETIKRLSEDRLSKRRTWYGQRQSLCSESAELYLDIEPLTPDLDDYRDAILVRQFSEPVSFSRDDLLDMRSTLSIFDAPISLDNSMDQSWPPNLSRVQLRHRPHSVSVLTSSRSFGMESSQEWMEGSDKPYEEILQRNIRLWKVRHSVHTSDDEEEGTRTPVNDWSFPTANGRRSPVSLAEVSPTRKRDSGSSSSSVINSSGSSYGSSAVNGGSSRSSCSSCSSCVFSGLSVGVEETMTPKVTNNSFSDFGNVVAENSCINLTCDDAEPLENSVTLTLGNGAISDGHRIGDEIDFRCTNKCREGGNEERSVCDDGDQTPVIETGEPVIEWMQGDCKGRNGEERSDEGEESGGGFGMRVPDGKERDAMRGIDRVSGEIAGCVKEGETQITGGADGISCTSGAGVEIGSQEDGPEVGMTQELELERRGELEESICVKGAGGQVVGEEDRAVGGIEEGESRQGEKEGRHRGKEGGGGGGDKPKGKESSGGGVVRALWDHIGRKIENRVTVGMAGYSRSFLPVISEISKKDGRQKSGAHRPRELDIT